MPQASHFENRRLRGLPERWSRILFPLGRRPLPAAVAVSSIALALCSSIVLASVLVDAGDPFPTMGSIAIFFVKCWAIILIVNVVVIGAIVFALHAVAGRHAVVRDAIVACVVAVYTSPLYLLWAIGRTTNLVASKSIHITWQSPLPLQSSAIVKSLAELVGSNAALTVVVGVTSLMILMATRWLHSWAALTAAGACWRCGFDCSFGPVVCPECGVKEPV